MILEKRLRGTSRRGVSTQLQRVPNLARAWRFVKESARGGVPREAEHDERVETTRE
jgi:hypothetical protein